MFNSVLIGVFTLGVVLTFVLPFLVTQNQAYKKRFNLMDNPDLIQAGLRTGTIKGKLRLMAYLVPLPVVIIVHCVEINNYRTLIIACAFIIIFACLSSAQVLGAMEKLIMAEMERRKISDNQV